MDSAMSDSENIVNQGEISLENWSSLTPEEQVIAFQKLPYSEADDFFLGLSARDQEQATKGGRYAMHSQSAQALCQEPAEMGPFQTSYPHHPKPY